MRTRDARPSSCPAHATERGSRKDGGTCVYEKAPMHSRIIYHLLIAKFISLVGYLLPIYAAYHWYPSGIEAIDKPPWRFIVTLVLAVIFVLAGQVYEMVLMLPQQPRGGRNTTSL